MSKNCLLKTAFLKKFLGEDLMLLKEKVLQTLLSWSNFPPSIVYESMVKKELEENIAYTSQLEDILACPECKGILSITNNEAKCKKCSKIFLKKDDIWDFRVK